MFFGIGGQIIGCIRMSEDKKVVWLAFKSDNVEPEGLYLRACVTCRNKTYLLVDNGDNKFPSLRCAACGFTLGNVGWADEP